MALSRETILQAYAVQHAAGLTVRQAAEAMKMSLPALDQVLVRAKRRGDPRALRVVPGRPVPDRSRREYILARWEEIVAPGLTYAEAADIIGCTRNALSQAQSRARKEGISVTKAPPYIDPTRS